MTTVTTSPISYEETITYEIVQEINTLGVNCIDRYSSLVFCDVIPAGLTPKTIYIYINGKYISRGEITIISDKQTHITTYASATNANIASITYFGYFSYLNKDRKLYFYAGSDFLTKTLTMSGERLSIYIDAILTDSTVTKLENTATWTMNGTEITSNKVITHVVNRQSFSVYYYRESSSGGWEQVYVQSVREQDILNIPSEATKAATRSNCSGFTGWYTEDPKNASAVKISNKSLTITGDLYLYGRNYCTVNYKTATDSTSQSIAARSLFADQALTLSTTLESTYPSSQTIYWGQTIELSGKATLFYLDGEWTKRVKSCNGAYVDDPSASGTRLTSATITKNCTMYKTWSDVMYDGVIARR